MAQQANNPLNITEEKELNRIMRIAELKENPVKESNLQTLKRLLTEKREQTGTW